ncbi:MAG: ABC transporter substrate-binding protein [Hymenobacteraceae bacterium]|nr:ABC transporter substrate-binding protein [Hymenobacteraceae bacterium]
MFHARPRGFFSTFRRSLVDKLRAAVLLTGLAGGLLACDSAAPTDPRRVFRYNQSEQSGALTSLDPAFARNQANIWAQTQLFNGLIELDSALRPAPALAHRWTVSADARTYTFRLRPGVRFHDDPCFPEGKGRVVRAADVVYAFRRLLDPATASTGGWIFRGKVLSDSAGVPRDSAFQAPNDSTIVVRLGQPFAAFLSLLSMPYAFVVAPEAVARYGRDFGQHPVGTGPFRFHVWNEGSALVLHRNPTYWRLDARGRRLPYLDAVQISFIGDKKTEFLTFLQGKLDFLSGIRESSRDLILRPDGQVRPDFAGRFRVEKVPYLNTEYLGFQLDSATLREPTPAVRDRRVRQALSFAIDRRAYVRFLLSSVGQPGTSGMVPPALASFDEKAVPGYAYDPARARALLREAGYGPGGRPLSLKLSTVAEKREQVEFLQQQWAAVGATVTLDINQGPAHQELVDNGKAAFWTKSWLGDYPDAENYLALFYSPNFSPAGPDKTHFRSAAYDQVYEQALREPDEARRLTLYQQLDRQMLAECPVIVLYYDEVIRLTQPTVRGLRADPMNQLRLERVRKGNF